MIRTAACARSGSAMPATVRRSVPRTTSCAATGRDSRPSISVERTRVQLPWSPSGAPATRIPFPARGYPFPVATEEISRRKWIGCWRYPPVPFPTRSDAAWSIPSCPTTHCLHARTGWPRRRNRVRRAIMPGSGSRGWTAARKSPRHSITRSRPGRSVMNSPSSSWPGRWSRTMPPGCGACTIP